MQLNQGLHPERLGFAKELPEDGLVDEERLPWATKALAAYGAPGYREFAYDSYTDALRDSARAISEFCRADRSRSPSSRRSAGGS
jgi:hypothetical protein